MSGGLAEGKVVLVSRGGSGIDYPMRRLGEPSEISEAVVWLCSDKASFVHGESLLVDGGFYTAHQRRPLESVIKQRRHE
jgi:NAD(P)-dependent dehydrogenase (short-subunit alcohol dehydrogenase family)